MDAEFENFKEQVRSAADIVEVISGYVTLKKKGQNFWGCCPFHGEKTPSFAVNPGKNMFYCFGCHEGGDIFKFIMKSENCSFMEALKLLAARYGIPVPERQKTAAEIRQEKESAGIFHANELASRFFQACLLKTDYGKDALAYLSGRGITGEIIERFTIGYALNSYNALLSSLGRRDCGSGLLVRAGLALTGSRGVYDKFRNRVMIPIKDPRGRIVGFGGRVLDDSTPKYLNTGETAWFNKRYLLFGMDIALKEIRKKRQAIVVEGYMDAISLHAAGIGNAVASMGTAFSAEQAKLLKRAAEEVIFCYDSDEAGRRASVRAVSIAGAAGLKVRIAGVPDGKDPDEFVRHHGREAFLQVISEAQNGIDFQIDETILQNNVTNLAGKVDAVSNILPFLLECKNEIEVAEHIRRMAQKLTIDEGLIIEEYRKAARRSGGRTAAAAAGSAGRKTVTAEQQAEEMLLAVFLENPGLAELYRDEIESAGFTVAAHGQIYNALLQAQGCEAGGAAGRVNSLIDGEATSVLAGIIARQQPQPDSSEKIIKDCLRRMKCSFLEKEYEKHRLLADEYERSADGRYLDELRESQRIKNEINKIYGK